MKTYISNNYTRNGLLVLVCVVIFLWNPLIDWFSSEIAHEISEALYSRDMAFLASDHFAFLMKAGKFLGVILNPFGTNNPVYQDLYFAGVYLVFVCLALISIRYLLRQDICSFLGLRRFDYKRMLGSTGTIVTISLCLILWYAHDADAPSIESQTGISIRNPYLWFRFGVLFPVIEEVLMRGFLYQLTMNVLKNKTGHLFSVNTIVIMAIVFQTIIWILSHTQYSGWAFAGVIQMGLTLGFIRYRTNSLYPCIVFHGAYNIIAVLL